MSFAPLKQPLGPANRDRSLAEVVELPPVFAPTLGVPVLFHDGLTDSPGAGQITAWDTHSAIIEAPPTTRALLRWEDRVVIESFDGLLVDYVRGRGSHTVIRGLRAVQDFEYEFQMTMMNRRLAPDVDTVFMMTDEEYFYIASRTVKEVAALGGDISGLVPEIVAREMRARS